MSCRMCAAAAISLNIFHPGYSLPEPEETHNDRSEQKQAREKTKGYSMMNDVDIFLTPPAPMSMKPPTTNMCPRCACWEDRRSWI